MIISHSHKFIFIKTRKTAGSSIQKALAEQCTVGDIITGTLEDFPSWALANPSCNLLPKLLHPHLGWKDIKENFSTEWTNYTKFTCERNPYDKLMSLFHWQTRSRVDPPSFQNWFNSLSNSRMSDFDLYGSQYGDVLVDFVIQYDSLEKDYYHVCNLLGMTPMELPFFKSGFKPLVIPREDYFPTLTLQQRVKKFFWREIKNFGYTF